MQLRAAEVADRLGGTRRGDVADLVVDGLAIDSRSLRPGQLFAALTDVRDGHDFVPAARAAGAACVLVERVVDDGPAIVVPSVPRALAELARIARSHLPDRVVGITGSVGKTTTKDLLANVLARSFSTVASERSFNNELGVPLTLANAPDGTQAAVVEMGARGAGHINTLCEMARPTVGVVTVVEAVHTEVMGGIDQIAVAKRELVEHLPADGAAVLNAGDPNVAAMAAHTSAEVVTFGDGGDVIADDVTIDDELRSTFVLQSPWGTAPVRLGARGRHNVTNALAATAAGLWLGVGVADVAGALGDAPASPWRMELTRTAAGLTVLNDAYNAGPASMAAALHALAALPVEGRRVAVLGVMAELGPEGPDEHRRIAEVASDLGIEVVAVGCDLYGPAPVEVVEVERLGLGSGDAVLVKGSRVAGLERVAEALTRPDRR